MAADLHVFPIRHHSPACATHLVAAFAEIRPKTVLIEAPADFAPIFAGLTDKRIIPPVAILSLATGGEGGASYYPLCDHSPEWQAARWALAHGAMIDLIDLPSRAKAMRHEAFEAAGQPILLAREDAFTTSRYVAALAARIGARDGHEVWDRLFESRLASADWRGFFNAVGLYCDHLRATTRPETMAADGTLAREDHMAWRLALALAGSEGPIALVIGGFHGAALRRLAASPAPPPPPADAARLSLIRYGFTALERANGYAAGLPMPGYYDRLWRLASAGRGADLWQAAAMECFTEFAEPRLGAASIIAAVEAATRLADLRGLPGPGRSELLDALRSTAIREAIELDAAPLLGAFAAFLTGDRFGVVPPGRYTPPLIEDVRKTAQALRFSLDRATPATRDLDLYRRDRDRAASRFLHALDLIGAGFARRLSGPDFTARHRTGVLHETWRYAWGPGPEAALVDRAADGDRLDAVCRVEILRRLTEADRRSDAVAASRLFAAACHAGLVAELGRIEPVFTAILAETGQIAALITAFPVLLSVTRIPGAAEAERVAARRLIGPCYRRIILLLPTLADLAPAQALATMPGLADLANFVVGHEVEGLDLAPDLLAAAVTEFLAQTLPPFLAGAIAAIAVLLGALDQGRLDDHLRAGFAGVYPESAQRVAMLTGLLSVAPRLFTGSASLIRLTHDFLDGLDDAQFLECLPELRLAFSVLNPSEIDRIAAALPFRRDLQVESAVPAAELAENMALSARLEALWRADGLAEWLGVAG